jgi:hypothetical protein
VKPMLVAARQFFLTPTVSIVTGPSIGRHQYAFTRGPIIAPLQLL